MGLLKLSFNLRRSTVFNTNTPALFNCIPWRMNGSKTRGIFGAWLLAFAGLELHTSKTIVTQTQWK
jgi:hypothetical protein